MNSNRRGWPVLPLAALVACGCVAEVGDPGQSAGLGASEDGPLATASEAYSIPAITFAPYHGGDGGNPYVLACAAGEVATGIYGRSGAYIDQLGLLCSALQSDGSLGVAVRRASVGGGGGSAYSTPCPEGQAVVGFYGRSGKYVDQIGLQCATISTWVSGGSIGSYSPPNGGGGGSQYNDTCPRGYVITHVVGRSGGYVDAQQATCLRVMP